MIEKILIAEDDPLIRNLYLEILLRKKKEVIVAENGKQAIDKIQQETFDLIIADLHMPFFSGTDVLIQAKKTQPSTPVIIATGDSNIETAVNMIKLGAFDYICKPFSIQLLESKILKAENHLKLIKENQLLKQIQSQNEYPSIVAQSPQMKKILQSLEKIAKSHASVFITGESGTGKEVVGALIHALSDRKNQAFIKVNCAAIPHNLIESEFFGHEKGAFTGAFQRKMGKFELANEGSFLLDEVTEIPQVIQAKLLRAIQEMEFERVGGTKPIKVNIRFIATSNRNMTDAIESKIFREDLFYRLNVVPIHIPPLRERKEDIIPLCDFFLKKFCQENHKPLKKLSEKASEKLLNYSWPGNVRELSNIIERTVVMDFSEEIQSEHLYLDSNSAPPSHLKISHKSTTLYELEKMAIFEALKQHLGNKTKTASSLGISIRTLRNKLHEYEAYLESNENL